MAAVQHITGGLPTARSCPFDPSPELTRLTTEQPLARMTYPDGHVGWLVTNHLLAREVLAHPDLSARHELRPFPVPIPVRPAPAAPGLFIGMDPPDHTRYRKPLNRYFTVRRIRELEPVIARACAEQLDVMERQGPPVDLMEAFALSLPLRVISEMLGSTPEINAELQRLRITTLSPTASREEVIASIKATDELMHELVRLKRKVTSEDLLSLLIAEGQLNDQELAGVAHMMLAAGHETTGHTIGLGVYFLLQHGELRQTMSATPTLTDDMAHELLRYLSVVQFVSRTALADIELGDVQIRQGESITVSIPAANRDTAQIEDAASFDPERIAKSNLSFGHGLHQCIGHNLARAEIKIAIPAVLRRFPGLRLDARPEDLTTREAMNTYGLHRLPVAW